MFSTVTAVPLGATSSNDNDAIVIEPGPPAWLDDADADRVLDAQVDAQTPREDGCGIELLDGPALATDDPELEYIIPALGMTAGSGAPHVFAGYGYSGKTMLAQGLALSMAAGRNAWGGLTCLHGRVVHVDLEQGARLTKRRYKRLALAAGVSLPDLGDRLVVAARPELQLHAGQRDRWLTLMQGRDLLVVDSWRAACPGVDENSSEVRASLDMLGALSEETRCRAVLIHHAKKPTEATPTGSKYSIRGSSGFYDGADGVYVFSSQKGEPIKVTCEKAREHGDDVEDITVEIDDAAGPFGPRSGLTFKLYGPERLEALRSERAAAATKAAVAAALPKVVAAISRAAAAGAPLASLEAIRAAVGLGKAIVVAAIQTAQEAGQIHRLKAGRNASFLPGRAIEDSQTESGPNED